MVSKALDSHSLFRVLAKKDDELHAGIITDLSPRQEIKTRRSAVSSVLQMVTSLIFPKLMSSPIFAVLVMEVTIVMSPLISLMKDQVDVLTKRHISAAYVDEYLKTYDDMRAGVFMIYEGLM
jgi:hypothetical protein